MSEPLIALRADKYLHHVRIFKTRSLATQACDKGQVTIAEAMIKPSRDVRAGDVLRVVRGDLVLVVRVLALPESRVGAPLVAQFCENLTPKENYEKARDARLEREWTTPVVTTPLTKKDMRAIREWLGR